MTLSKFILLAAVLILAASITTHQATLPSGTYQIDRSSEQLPTLATKLTFDNGKLTFR